MRKIANNFIDISGMKFGLLTAIKQSDRLDNSGTRRYWIVKCDCGNIKEIYKTSLTRNKTKSCGCINRALHLRKSDSPFKNLYNRHLTQSSNRGLITNLTVEQFRKLSESNCFYCGCSPAHINYAAKNCKSEWKEQTKYYFNGIDRKNNDIGYLLENCVTCCGQCNRMKLNYTYDSFIEKVKGIYEHHILIKGDADEKK